MVLYSQMVINRKPLSQKYISKKGQIESIILVIVLTVIIGLILFLFNHVNETMFQSFEEYFNSSEKYTNDTFNGTTLNTKTEALTAIEKFTAVERTNIWDFVVLAVFFGFLLQLAFFSWATRINVAFYWITVVIGIIGLFVGNVMSNLWIQTSSNPVFAETITRFPITNMLLGSKFPIIIVGIIGFAIIILFAKRSNAEGFG